jgi:hypothetical protein
MKSIAEKRIAIMARYNVRIDQLKEKRKQALKAFDSKVTESAKLIELLCENLHCGSVSYAPDWRFEWAYEYSKCASYGAWSEPESGYVRQPLELSRLVCPKCRHEHLIALHKQRDAILNILQHTEVIAIPDSPRTK